MIVNFVSEDGTIFFQKGYSLMAEKGTRVVEYGRGSDLEDCYYVGYNIVCLKTGSNVIFASCMY